MEKGKEGMYGSSFLDDYNKRVYCNIVHYSNIEFRIRFQQNEMENGLLHIQFIAFQMSPFFRVHISIYFTLSLGKISIVHYIYRQVYNIKDNLQLYLNRKTETISIQFFNILSQPYFLHFIYQANNLISCKIFELFFILSFLTVKFFVTSEFFSFYLHK